MNLAVTSAMEGQRTERTAYEGDAADQFGKGQKNKTVNPFVIAQNSCRIGSTPTVGFACGDFRLMVARHRCGDCRNEVPLHSNGTGFAVSPYPFALFTPAGVLFPVVASLF